MRSICSITNCARHVKSHGWCRLHSERAQRHGGDPLGGKSRMANGSGHVAKSGYVVLTINGEKRFQHVIVAEVALGKPLPPGVEVHHIDEVKSHNEPTNLVICPDAAYHKLLHQRQRAFDECGHYDWRICMVCKTYDETSDMVLTRKKAYHRSCYREMRRAMYAQKKRRVAAPINSQEKQSHV